MMPKDDQPLEGKVSSSDETGAPKSISIKKKPRRAIRNALLSFRVTAAERERFKVSAKQRKKTTTKLMEDSLREHYSVDKEVRGRKLAPPPLTKDGATRLALAQVLASILAQAEQWHQEALYQDVETSAVAAELDRLNASVTKIATAAGLFPHIAKGTSPTESTAEK